LLLLCYGLLIDGGTPRHVNSDFFHSSSQSSSFYYPQIQINAPPPNSFSDVHDFGAKGDGMADDTTAFQNAINSFGTPGGGIVYAPSGTYRFNGSLNIPKGVSILGTYMSVSSHTPAFDPNDLPNYGTVFLPYQGRGSESGSPFITLKEDSTVRGVVVYYPEQVGTQVPVPYPWTFSITGVNCAIIDVECLNCWNAILANRADRHYIARIQGQPINIGISIDAVYDIGRVENVHWNPWFSNNKAYISWQLVHGRAFVIARTDWEYMFNTFAFGYAIGYHFVKSETGACNGNFLGIGADMMANASVLVEAADPWGILITNGEFTAFVDPGMGPEYVSPAQIVVTSTNTGSLRLSNTAFWGPSDNIARLAGGTTSFVNCYFDAWDAHNKGDFAIDVTAGSIQISTCDFHQDGNHISLGSGVDRAVVLGNLFGGNTKITNNCKNTQIGLNVDATPPPNYQFE